MDSIPSFACFVNFNIFFYCLRFPFDWKTPVGYCLAFVIECAAAFSVCSSLIPMICFHAGSCWLFVSFVNDTIIILSLFNLNVSNENHDRVKERFFNIIKLQSVLKELSDFRSTFDFTFSTMFSFDFIPFRLDCSMTST